MKINKIEDIKGMDTTSVSYHYFSGDEIHDLNDFPILRKNYKDQKEFQEACVKAAKENHEEQFLDELNADEWAFEELIKFQEDFCVKFF